MYNIEDLSIGDITSLRASLRAISDGAKSMEEVAERLVRFFYNSFGNEQSGKRSIVLARFYKTHQYKDLNDELQQFAARIIPAQQVTPDMRCLTLLATAGEKPEWNTRKYSTGHKAIPLPSKEMIEKLPMVAQLVKQLGMDINMVVNPNPELIMDLAEKTYNVFHIREALNSKYIPAQQEFVIPHKVRSVVGFGGLLPWGDLFSMILFANVAIPKASADKLKTIALGVKTLVLPFSGKQVFNVATADR